MRCCRVHKAIGGRLKGVYRIRCVVDGRRYIGSSLRCETRWTEHKRALTLGKHANRYLQLAWDEHGSAGFRFKIIRELPDASREELIQTEAVLIRKLEPAFNIVLDPCVPPLCRPGSEVGRAAVGAASRKRLQDPAQRAAFRANVSRPEAMARVVTANRARAKDPISIARSLAAMSTPEARKKHADAIRGRKLPLQHRRKICEGMKAAWADPEKRAAMLAARRK